MSVSSYRRKNNKKLRLYYSNKASRLFNFNLTAGDLNAVDTLTLPTNNPLDYVILTYFHFYELSLDQIVDSGQAITVNTTGGYFVLNGGYDIDRDGVLKVGVRSSDTNLTVIAPFETAKITYYVFMLTSQD